MQSIQCGRGVTGVAPNFAVRDCRRLLHMHCAALLRSQVDEQYSSQVNKQINLCCIERCMVLSMHHIFCGARIAVGCCKSIAEACFLPER